MIDTDNEDFETYEEQLEREIRSLKRKLKGQDGLIEQLKKERHEALDKAHSPERGSCPRCKANEEQYDKMRAAFERRKEDHKAITALLKHINLMHEGEPLTITRMVKLGKRYTQ